MKIIYQDKRVLVCVKPAGIRSTDEPGGLPSLLREQLGDMQACVRTVHRLDQVTAGLMVLARSRKAASVLAQEFRNRETGKNYYAVVHGCPEEKTGVLKDLLLRDKAKRVTLVVDHPQKDAQDAELEYEVLEEQEGLALLRITLHTGRTHQIRAQFSSRGMPLWGDRKYGAPEEGEYPALFSCRLEFNHPETGEKLTFSALPEEAGVWEKFEILKQLRGGGESWQS